MGSSSSQSSAMDERGHIFLLPRLGLPDPAGEWVSVKAAIGTKEDALYRLVYNKQLKMPLRHREAETVLMPIDVKNGTLIFPFFQPASEDPTAKPEYFTVFAWYVPSKGFSDDGTWTRSKLPESTDWVIYPMAVYEDMAPHFSNLATGTSPEPRKKKKRSGAEYQIEVGTAAQAAGLKAEDDSEDSEEGIVRRKLYAGTVVEGGLEGDDVPTILLGEDCV